jgi:HSP20 family molecular chaperone IbpA
MQMMNMQSMMMPSMMNMNMNMMMMRNKCCMDICETERCYVVMMDCAGCTKDMISCEVFGDVLRICCMMPDTCKTMCSMMGMPMDKSSSMPMMMCHRCERGCAPAMMRCVKLPSECIVKNKICAKVENGVCCVTIPKSEEYMKQCGMVCKIDCM